MRSVFIALFLVVLSSSSAFCLIPVMVSTSQDPLRYGESPDFKAGFPFSVVNSKGEDLGSCSGSFVDVDGDVFFITAAHCLNFDEAKGIEVKAIMHKGLSNAKSLDNARGLKKAYIQSTLRAEDFVINWRRNISNELYVVNYDDDNKKIQQRMHQLSDAEQENPLKILEIVYNNIGGGRYLKSSCDLAFLPMDSSVVPPSVKPFKLYKGLFNQLIGEKGTTVGFGKPKSSPPSFSDLFGCSLNSFLCDDLEGPMRRAGDLEIFGKVDNHNIFMVYPSNSKFALDIPVNLISGDSGGPVLYKDENGDFSIIGVNSKVFDGNMLPQTEYFDMNRLRAKGSTQIGFVQFIEPQLLEKARFKKHGLIDAIDQKNESLLLEAIENGLLGVNHDSGSFLLKSAIDNDLREFAAELINKGVSSVYNFDVLCSLAEKEIWTVFDAVLESINHSINNAENSWEKLIRGIRGFRHIDLCSLEVEVIQKRFLLMSEELKNNDRTMIQELLGDIKEISRSKETVVLDYMCLSD